MIFFRFLEAYLKFVIYILIPSWLLVTDGVGFLLYCAGMGLAFFKEAWTELKAKGLILDG